VAQARSLGFSEATGAATVRSCKKQNIVPPYERQVESGFLEYTVHLWTEADALAGFVPFQVRRCRETSLTSDGKDSIGVSSRWFVRPLLSVGIFNASSRSAIQC
jgi:hypothetical protein